MSGATNPTLPAEPHQAKSPPDPNYDLPQPVKIAGEDITRNAASEWMIGSQTLAPGAPALTFDGTLISLQPSANALVVGSSTMPLTAPSIFGVDSVDGQGWTLGADSNLVIGTQTIKPGSPAVTISGTRISLAVSGAVVVASSTLPITRSLMSDAFTLGGLSFSRGPGSALIIGTKTLTPGAPAITISGTPISLPASGYSIIIGGSTIPIPTSPVPPLTTNPPSPDLNLFTTAAGLTLSYGPNSALMIGTQTLNPGGPVTTISSTPIFLAASSSSLLTIGSSTMPLSPPTSETILLEVSGFTFTETSGSLFVLGSQTLTPGGSAITVNSTAISLAPGAT
ncbi:MAG: hypothetical protein Q9222_006730, partial [Ikaeria aurantiellina]